VRALLDSAARRQVCVVIAAAGCGKSTAVGSWAGERPAAWVDPGMDPADTGLFAGRLLDALRPHAGPPPTHLADPAKAKAANDRFFGYSAAVCGWLRDVLVDDLVLVVDDVHDLPRGSGPARLVEGMCRHASGRLHLMLLSRYEPPFSLARLRGRGLVSEVDAPDLAFGLAEVDTLLRESMGDCPIEVARLVWERTAGWPAAVRWAADMLRGAAAGDHVAVLDRLVRPGERFHTYLAEEVIGREPDEVWQLLRRLAVLGSVGPATETTIGGPRTAARLADLDRRGLVRRIPGQQDRWSLVRPLREFVEQTAMPQPSERARLHMAAAADCARRGSVAGALRHSVAAGDHATCARLLIEHGAVLVSRGQVAAVQEAAESVIEHDDDPRIQQVLGQARQVRGQCAMALECFRIASRDQTELEPEIAMLMGMIAYSQGEFDQVLALPGRTRFSGTDPSAEARVLALVATTRRTIGDYAGAIAAADRAMSLVEEGAAAACHAAMALLASADGDCRQAEAHCVSALESAEAAGDLQQMLWARLVRASMLGELAAPAQALADAEAAVALGEACEDAFLTAHALTTRAAARMRQGMLDRSLDDFAQARDMFQRIGSRFLSWPLCGMGDVYRLRGQLTRARAAYEEALGLSEPCNEVLGMGSALTGLARVRAADDLETAAELAQRAVALGEGLRHVQALLARGWVALQAGNRQQAAADSTRAAAAARGRRDSRGLAEALLLGVLSSTNPAQHTRSLSEAIQIWRETGSIVGEAVAGLVAAGVGARVAGLDPERAARTLRERGIDLRHPRPAGPLAVLARSAPSVSIRALGGFQVIREGVALSKSVWQSRKARELLKILVARRRPVPRDQLMELLWPKADPSRSGNRLSVLLSTLRDVLQPRAEQPGQVPLGTDGSAVWLDHVDVDVERFLAGAAAALDAHRQDQPDATARLVAAEAAHTGGFLDDDPYQDWAAPLAEEVRATHVALLRALVSRLRSAGEVDEVVRYTLRLLDNDRFDEHAHLGLIEVLLEAGRYGEARRRYRIYGRAMTELGIQQRPFPLARRRSSVRTG
jgi:DNA-binding SARP family transcriptional activator